MTAKEFYDKIGGNYNEIIGRLMSEDIIPQFCDIFFENDCYQQLLDGMNEKDVDKAFRAAHTLKGISANMAFTQLTLITSAITECLRAGDMDGATIIFPKLKREYEKAESAYEELKN